MREAGEGDGAEELRKPEGRNWLWTAVRVVVGLGLAVFLIRATLRAAGVDFLRTVAQADALYLVGAFALFGVALSLTFYRWWLLLSVQGVHPRPWQIARLSLIGVFFNMAVPGAVGGDLIKMGYVAREAPDRRSEAILTIVLDRILGMLGLFLVASVLVLISLDFLVRLGREHRILQLAAFLVGVGSLGGVVALVLLAFHDRLVRLPGIRTFCAWGDDHLPGAVTDIVGRIVRALDLYRDRPGVVAAGTGVSVGVHSLLALSFVTIGQALGETALSLREYFLATQVANAAAAIPVTPAGLGARDAVAALFFEAMGAASGRAGAIPVLFTCVMVGWSLVGGIVFVFSRSGQLKTTPSAAREGE